MVGKMSSNQSKRRKRPFETEQQLLQRDDRNVPRHKDDVTHYEVDSLYCLYVCNRCVPFYGCHRK
ncbi:hypothetical protein MNL08_02800 [Bartonella krasnovii]|nr:hypothetical protein [Bartonella krasnovii]UNF42775.1 hypothetical protein MNL08_02800 [Bartonella krasnovii]